MKKSIVAVVLMTISLSVATVSHGQFKRPTKPGTGTTGTGTTGTGTTGTGTTGTGTTGSKDTTVKPGRREVSKEEVSSPNQFGSPVKPSLKPQYGFDTKNTQVADRTPLSYEHLREEDVVFSHFIWREIDAREKMNKVFSYPGKDGDADQRFFAILLDFIKDTSGSSEIGPFRVFSADDDRFTTPLSYDSILGKVSELANVRDTQYVPNLQNPDVEDTVITWKVNAAAPKPDSIYTFRIKEQVMFDKESSRLFTRIIGIAPVAKISIRKGMPSEPKTLFWVYYPDLRRTLSKKFVYNGKNVSGRMTWEDLFESRFFSSYIVKSSVDNPTDQNLKELIKDPLFRLLEGENIKEKIFNYEQNLWAY
jgi:gliding motility associated protien GldN